MKGTSARRAAKGTKGGSDGQRGFVRPSLFSVVSLRGEANLPPCTQTDGRRGEESSDSWERPRAVFITKAADGLLAKKHVSRFSLGSQSQWNGNKEASGRAAVPRYAAPPPPSWHGPQLHGCLQAQREQGETEMGGSFLRKERKKRVKSGMKTQKEKQSKVWGEVENMRKRRRPTRPQTSMAVLKLNEMEGRSVGKAAKKARGGLYIRGGHAGKMIPAVNFLYIARKSIRGGEEAGPRVLGRSAAPNFLNPHDKSVFFHQAA